MMTGWATTMATRGSITIKLKRHSHRIKWSPSVAKLYMYYYGNRYCSYLQVYRNHLCYSHSISLYKHICKFRAINQLMYSVRMAASDSCNFILVSCVLLKLCSGRLCYVQISSIYPAYARHSYLNEVLGIWAYCWEVPSTLISQGSRQELKEGLCIQVSCLLKIVFVLAICRFSWG